MTNYVGVDTRGILDSVDAEIRGIRNDRSLSEEQRAFYIRELQEKGRDQYAANRKKADDKLEATRRDATRRRYPVEDFGGDVGTELKLSRIREELLSQWRARGDGPTLAEYERALATGDDLRARVMQTSGPEHINNTDMRLQFQRRISQVEEGSMTDDQRAADAELKGLDQVELNHRYAQGMQDTRAREILDKPAEQLASTRPGESVDGPTPPFEGSSFHGG